MPGKRQSPPNEVEEQQLQGVIVADDPNHHTPSKRVRLNVLDDEERQVQQGHSVNVEGRVVTPVGRSATSKAASSRGSEEEEEEDHDAVATTATSTATTTTLADGTSPLHPPSSARRNLFTPSTLLSSPTHITPLRNGGTEAAPAAKRRLMFGRMVTETHVPDNVRKVYKIVKKLTGSLGGNASSGPIYGELTMGSMQKMINLMKEHTDFNATTSRFIDVGSGIGKPNLHVAQDPGCASYGIEVEASRWLLGMTCLKGVLDAAVKEHEGSDTSSMNHLDQQQQQQRIGHQCFFEQGDIRQAKTFDPFTHVYMFSIGFPPTLWIELAKIWNRSLSPYMICYHGPRDIIETYEFEVELVEQTQTSMHGSREGHMGYIYKRKYNRLVDDRYACDPQFAGAFQAFGQGLTGLKAKVDVELEVVTGNGTCTRRASRRR